LLGHLPFRRDEGALRALVAALALASLGLSGCARKAPEAAPQPIAYPYSSATPRVFYATETGLVAEAPAERDGAAIAAARPASRSPNASILSSNDASIIAAINGWGMARIEINTSSNVEQGANYRVVGTPLPELFSGLSTGGAWPVKGGMLVQLYRNPFYEDADANQGSSKAGLPSSRLFFIDDSKTGEAKVLDPFVSMAGPGYELFALLPSGGSWFAELRKDSPERVDLEFFTLGDPLATQGTTGSPNGGAIRGIQRSDFEAALKPRPLSSLEGDPGKTLRTALTSLGAQSWLTRLRSASGEDAWYLSSGAPEDASTAYAWADGDRVTVLRQDGWIATADAKGSRSLTRFALPRSDASFTALATAGDLVAAAWEAGVFPSIEAAGLVVARFARAEK